jgi:hypothetical protein
MNNIEEQQLVYIISFFGGAVSFMCVLLYFFAEIIVDTSLSMLPKDDKTRKKLFVSDREFIIKFGKILAIFFFFLGLTMLFFSKHIVKYS